MLLARGSDLARRLDEIVAGRCAVVGVGKSLLSGDAAAALLFSDWAVMHPEARLAIDSPAAMAGAIWRIGDRSLLLLGREIASAEALALGLCDSVGDADDFLAGRSETALDAAAALISRRGGDALERATFAWLFATGAPAIGLQAFLTRRPPRFAPE